MAALRPSPSLSQTKTSCLFWFRRDLRLQDNRGLHEALQFSSQVSNQVPTSVQPLFIFDTNILNALKNPRDRRVSFIYAQIKSLKAELQRHQSDLQVFYGDPLKIFSQLLAKKNIAAVYANHDYEPQALRRDQRIAELCKSQGVLFSTWKDQVIFEKSEILNDLKKPYSVFTPYKKKWLQQLHSLDTKSDLTHPLRVYSLDNLWSCLQKSEPQALISLPEMGFQKVSYINSPIDLPLGSLQNYAAERDFPVKAQGTSHLGIHFRFGTISLRAWVRRAMQESETWLSQLIWRDFFMQILWHYPRVETQSFRPEFDSIPWRESAEDFARWKAGMTGYPLVDAGMRELAATGSMPNRVRMVTASFLTKHLLQHWLKGECYFAAHLLDYDLAANNGNWQWAAGTGCDAAPYFRIFNPIAQAQKFDPQQEYIRQWVPEFGTAKYPRRMIDHSEARGRCLQAYAQRIRHFRN